MNEKPVKFKYKGEYVYGNLIGVFQFAEPFTPMLRGQVGGQIAYPVAVVDTLKYGYLEVRSNRIEHFESWDEQ